MLGLEKEEKVSNYISIVIGSFLDQLVFNVNITFKFAILNEYIFFHKC